jgi:hypothetical protein
MRSVRDVAVRAMRMPIRFYSYFPSVSFADISSDELNFNFARSPVFTLISNLNLFNFGRDRLPECRRKMLDLRIPGANPQIERSERENLLSADIPHL